MITVFPVAHRAAPFASRLRQASPKSRRIDDFGDLLLGKIFELTQDEAFAHGIGQHVDDLAHPQRFRLAD